MDSTSAAKKISEFIQMIFPSFLYVVLVTLVYRRHNGKNVLSARPKHRYQLLPGLGNSHQGVSALCFVLVAVHGIAPIALQFVDPETRFYWFVVALFLHACLTGTVDGAAMRAGFATFASTSA